MSENQNNEVAQRLLKVCMDYVEHHEIRCAESIYQRDIIYTSAPELVEQICDVIGYHPPYEEDGFEPGDDPVEPDFEESSSE